MQTAPTPARTCGTARPTNGTRVVTAAPDCPVSGSTAHNENVEYLRQPLVVDRHAVGGALLRRRMRGQSRTDPDHDNCKGLTSEHSLLLESMELSSIHRSIPVWV